MSSVLALKVVSADAVEELSRLASGLRALKDQVTTFNSGSNAGALKAQQVVDSDGIIAALKRVELQLADHLDAMLQKKQNFGTKVVSAERKQAADALAVRKTGLQQLEAAEIDSKRKVAAIHAGDAGGAASTKYLMKVNSDIRALDNAARKSELAQRMASERASEAFSLAAIKHHFSVEKDLRLARSAQIKADNAQQRASEEQIASGTVVLYRRVRQEQVALGRDIIALNKQRLAEEKVTADAIVAIQKRRNLEELSDRRMTLLHMRALEDNRKFDAKALAAGYMLAPNRLGKPSVSSVSAGPMRGGYLDATGLSQIALMRQAVAAATPEIDKHTAAHGRLHSALRGVAGGMGALWLSYGQYVAPMAAGFAAVMLVRKALESSLQFDYTARFTASLSDAGAGGDPKKIVAFADKIKAELLKVGETTKFSANELATGLRVMEQAGIDSAQGINLIAKASEAALMGEVDLKTATEDMIGVLEVFKLRSKDPNELAKNFERVGDVMATVAKNTKANLHDVAESLKGVIGVADQYGVKLETAAALVEQLGRAGITAGKAGTFTRNMLENLYGGSNSSAEAKSIRAQLGINAYDDTGKRKEDVKFLLEAFGKLKALNDIELDQSVAAMFNERGTKTAREVISMFSSMEQAIKTLQNSSGALGEFAKSLDGIAKLEFTEAAARWDDLMVKAMEGSEDHLNNLAKQLQAAFTDERVIAGMKVMLQVISETAGGMANIVSSLAMTANAASNYTSSTGLESAKQMKAEAEDVVKRYEGRNDSLGRATRLRAIETIRESSKTIDNHPLTKQRQEAEQQAQREAKSKAAMDWAKGVGAFNDLGREGRTVPNFKKAEDNQKQPGNQLKLPNKEQEAAARAAEQLSKAKLDGLVQRHKEEAAAYEQIGGHVEQMLRQQLDQRLLSEERYDDAIAAVSANRREESLRRAEQQVLDLRAESSLLSNEADKQRAAALIKAAEDSEEAVRRRVKFDKDLDNAQLISKRTQQTNKAKDHGKDKLGSFQSEAREDLRVDHERYRMSLLSAREAVAIEARLRVQERVKGELLDLDGKIADYSQQEGEQAQRLLLIYRKQKTELQQAALAAEDVAVASATRLFNSSTSAGDGAKRALKNYQDAAEDTATQVETVMTNAFKGMEDAMVTFAMTGKLEFRALTEAILADIVRITVQKGISKAMGGVMSLAAGAIGGGGGGFFSSLFHNGGVVGESSSAGSRSVSPALFYGAPRFHGGGIAGNEMPVIAERGEGIFTQAQMRALAPAGGNTTYNVSINVDASGKSETNAPSQAQSLAKQMEAAVKKVLVAEQRPGGMLA